MNRYVGCSKIEVLDETLGLSFPVLLMYPTEVPSQEISLGPFPMNVAMGAAIEAGTFPIVVISHGSGGSNMVYRTLAMHLAQHGFVVCTPQHHFNNRFNNEWEMTLENLTHRPRHISMTIDAICKDQRFAGHLQQDQVAVVGHSVGGYAAIAVAGGIPDTKHFLAFCQKPANQHNPYCVIAKNKGLQAQAIEVQADSRIKVVVLMAPDTISFSGKGALDAVNMPILTLLAEKDGIPAQATLNVLLKGLPNTEKLTHRIIPNAGHYSFLSPFPPTIQKMGSPAASDPAGFDREAFHAELNAEVLAFIQAALA